MLGIVVGLAAEARLAKGLGCPVEIGGGTAAGAAKAARKLIEAGATGLISFGLAGGLAPGLPAGTVVVPEAVVDGLGGHWPAAPRLTEVLGGGAGLLLAASSIVATQAAKSAAWRNTGAWAADLETGAIATATDLPFAVLRVICDPADRDLPPAALTALSATGGIQPLALVRSLMRHPGQLGGLIALGREAALARRALMAHVARIGTLAAL